MKPSVIRSLPGSLAAPFTAALVAGMLLCFPAQAPADEINYDEEFAPLAGEASGSGGLAASWTVKHEIPGKTKDGGEDSAWLAVTPSINGKELAPVYLEGDFLPLTGLVESAGIALVQLEDMNFDGHDDMRLIEGMSARGAYGPVYLFSPERAAFEKNEAFSELFMPEVDKDSKRVTAVYHASACENSSREYIVKGFDTLELVFEEGTECPEDLLEKNQYRSFERTYKDGKLVSEKTMLHAADEEPGPGGGNGDDNSDGDGAENPDLPLDAPEPAPTTSFTGKGIRADVPEGWSTKIDGETVVFAAPGGVEKGFVMAAVIPLPSNKHKDFLNMSKELAKNMKGKNVRERNGTIVEFDLPNGVKAVTEGTGKKSLLLGVYLGNHPVSERVLLSVKAAD